MVCQFAAVCLVVFRAPRAFEAWLLRASTPSWNGTGRGRGRRQRGPKCFTIAGVLEVSSFRGHAERPPGSPSPISSCCEVVVFERRYNMGREGARRAKANFPRRSLARSGGRASCFPCSCWSLLCLSLFAICETARKPETCRVQF